MISSLHRSISIPKILQAAAFFIKVPRKPAEPNHHRAPRACDTLLAAREEARVRGENVKQNGPAEPQKERLSGRLRREGDGRGEGLSHPGEGGGHARGRKPVQECRDTSWCGDKRARSELGSKFRQKKLITRKSNTLSLSVTDTHKQTRTNTHARTHRSPLESVNANIIALR